jgi:hypothetical protein
LTHTWAVYRGVVDKPPMLQDASPVAAVVIAFFEYIFEVRKFYQYQMVAII